MGPGKGPRKFNTFLLLQDGQAVRVKQGCAPALTPLRRVKTMVCAWNRTVPGTRETRLETINVTARLISVVNTVNTVTMIAYRMDA